MKLLRHNHFELQDWKSNKCKRRSAGAGGERGKGAVAGEVPGGSTARGRGFDNSEEFSMIKDSVQVRELKAALDTKQGNVSPDTLLALLEAANQEVF